MLVAFVGGFCRRTSLRWGCEGECTLIDILLCFTLGCPLSCCDSTAIPSADCNVMPSVCPASRSMCSMSLYSLVVFFVAAVFWDRASCGRTLCRLPSVKCPVPTTEPGVRWTQYYKPVEWGLDQDYKSNIPKRILVAFFPESKLQQFLAV